MEFEDISYKYRLGDLTIPPQNANVALIKKLSPEVVNLIHCPSEVVIGYFKDEVIARNVALALEYYKENNKA